MKFSRYVLYWCIDQNVPILNYNLAVKYCSRFNQIPTTGPDVRIAFPIDISLTREAIFNEYNDWYVVEKLVPTGSTVLLNKISGYPDEADEVIVNGEVIGHRWFDPTRWLWRFRPILHGVARMVRDEFGYYAKVDLPKLTRMYEIHRDRIVKAELPEEKGKIVALETINGKWQGIARLVRGKRLLVIKAWRKVEPLYIESRSSIKTMIEVNNEVLENYENEAIRFLKKMKSKYLSKKFVVSYSGGKDSLVALDLSVESIGEVEVLFNDTGLELPETLINVFEVLNAYGLELHLAKAEVNFLEIVKLLGPPGRDYRYCCKIIKLAPICKALKKISNIGTVSITGQRKWESFTRAKIARVSLSRWVANTVVLAPINDWTNLHVWLYIFKYNLPYNRAYEKGFDRIGCWLCPACELAEFDLIRRFYPNLWNWWQKYLENYVKESQLPSIWLSYGLWRWRRRYPGDLVRFLDKECEVSVNSIINKVPKCLDIEVSYKDGKFYVNYKTLMKMSHERFLELIKILDKNYLVSNDKIIIKKHSIVDLSNSQVICRSSVECLNILKIIARSTYCTFCRLCSEWCRTNAISIDNYLRVNEDACRECLICNNVCPVAEYLVMRSDVLKKLKNTQN